MKEPKKILIVRTDRIGDILLSTPVIKNLREAFPSSYIAFMCRPYTKDILEGNPYLDEVIIYDKYGKQKSIWSSIKFSIFLRKKRFDWAIVLHPTNRAHLVTFFAGIPFRVGWDKKLGFLLTKRIPHTKQEGKKHELEYTLDILREINIPIVDKTIYFPLKKDSQDKIDYLLSNLGVTKEEKIIVIHPSASCSSKRWPQEYFCQLIKLLKEKFSYKIIIITAKGEEKYAEKLIKEDVVDLRGRLNILEVGALLKRAILFISNDSGPVHIASALETPVISIFGRKDKGLSPARWKPLGRNSFYLHKDTGCKRCLAHNCLKGFLCLKAIKPDEVVKMAISILQSKDC
jgi:heptosyltransferase-2